MENTTNSERSHNTTFLDDCGDLLPRDRTCTTVRMSQFLLPGCFGELTSSKYPGTQYAIVQPHRLTGGEQEADPQEQKKDVERRAKALEARLPLHRALDAGKLPKPGSDDIKAMRHYLRQQKPGLNHAELDDEAVGARYQDHLHREMARERSQLGRTLQRAGYADARTDTPQELREAVQSVVYPAPFQPFRSRLPHVAFCAVFNQRWCHQGYSRGELITTIALAPGEELTLEVHSWTKETFKSERELAVESEITLSNRLTARDHLEVISKLATESKVGANANVDITIPVEGIPIGVGAGVDASTTLSSALDTTAQRTTESTTEAASALKSQRRLRIEVSRETGSEEKQLRKVANSNRCHTLNVHYFEVMSHFEVSFELVDLIPCVLLPVTEETITEQWVLCHEYLLKGGLLSRTFLPGFDAAKTLATQETLERQEEAAALPPATQETPAPNDPIETELAGLRRQIVNRYNQLLNAEANSADSVDDLVSALLAFDLLTAGQEVSNLINDMPELFALATLRLNPTAINALEGLKASDTDGESATSALRVFFSAVTPRDFKHVNPLGNIVGKALESMGIPEAVVDILVFTWPEILGVVRDDRGLYVAVKGAHERLANLAASLAIGDQENAAQAAFDTAAASAVFAGPQAPFSELELAEAQVEFERLKCHLTENRFHYYQLIWNAQSASEAWRKVFPQLDCFLERQPIGFVEDKAAYPVQFSDALRRFFPIDNNGETSLKDFLARLKEKFNDQSRQTSEIVLPTLGTVAEAVLGECCACEDYIIDSRKVDIRQGNARAALDEAKAQIDTAEANRRAQRIAADPADLSDPIEHAHGQLHVSVESSSAPSSED